MKVINDHFLSLTAQQTWTFS